jgi:uncharacterized protein (DUF885 family)
MPVKKLFALAALAALGWSGCAPRRMPESFAPLAEEFVYSSLALSPVGATGAGYHRHKDPKTGKELPLDEMLDDLSPSGIEQQRRFYQEFRRRLAAVKPEQLSPEDRADYDIVQDQISLNLLDLDEIRSYRHNPTVYIELLGNALFYPHVLEYAPQKQRAGHMIARLRKMPAFLEQARKNLEESPEIWTTVAIEENDGNIGLVEKIIPAALPEDLRPEFNEAARPALAALRGFQEYLKTGLAKRNRYDWRLGKEKYDKKFRYVLATDLTPDQVLANAESGIQAVRARMLELARPLHAKLYPGNKAAGDESRIIAETLAKIAARHSTPATYMSDAKTDLEEARAFVREKGLLPLPPRENLQVIETPEFMRGVYAVGGFMPAPALEPQLGAFYWITPIPENWPKQRIESKLREYNFYKLKLLTIHEAMPGHYVQFEYANDIEPKTRRILRAVFGNTPYIEGWAQYAEQMMIDNGFLHHSPELQLTFLKEELRVLANAILDIRLQTLGMTDQEALDLMEQQTFQEPAEAEPKLRRAKLTSAQLPAYHVGWRDWLRVREQYRQAKGSAYRLSGFHEQALREGAVPLPVLARLLTGAPLAAPK